ncbi:uncharacterized protein LOC117497142 isoform X3 [Trematomus bernacchii]|uniref:uncharacterized protein LOC117497142 isoform X3 n=1 Tax=Trematomus bernacchii TaxID=40690 RepID=UPI00146E1E4B|nr:uncharacterized protein LOC117497142 isoform X3 [Trematomus bernacchii]
MSRLPSQTPGEAAEGAVQDSEGEEHLLSWEGESPTVLSAVQVGQGQPFNYNIPEVPGPSGVGLPASSGHIPPPPPQTLLPAVPLMAASAAQPPPLRVPRTTAYRKRKAAEADAARGGPSPGSRQVSTPAASVARPRGSTLATLALQVCLTVRLPVGKLAGDEKTQKGPRGRGNDSTFFFNCLLSVYI